MQRLFAVGAALGPAVTEDLTRQGLTPARIGLVQQLHRAGPMSQRQLSEKLGCTARNVTGLVDAVEALGLVKRHRHPTDRRAVLVCLTDKGEGAVAVWHQRARAVAAHLFAEVPDDEVKQLSATLAVVLQRLRARSQDPAAE
jgi:DNA-binding MarR family transcriptional regulator